jgi:hypothetical protein
MSRTHHARRWVRHTGLRALLGVTLGLALSSALVWAQGTTPTTRAVPAASGLGYDVALATVRGNDGGFGDDAMQGHALRVGRAQWLGRWFRLRTEAQYHDLHRTVPADCAAACPPFERRRRLFASGVALEWHHRNDRWHVYPIAGIGAGYVRSTGGTSRVGVTRDLGVGVAWPVPGGWPTIAAEVRMVRVPRATGHAWHVPLGIDLRF